MLIITANKNPALWASAGRIWPQAQLMDWQELLRAFWQPATLSLLQSIEEKFIWQQCVSEHVAESQSSIEALAAVAEEAFWLVKHWMIDWSLLNKSDYANTRWFCAVAKTFLYTLQDHQCGHEIQLLEQAIDRINHHSEDAFVLLGAPDKIIFYGFLNFTPLQKRLLEALKKSTTVEWFQQKNPAIPLTPTLHVFDTAEEEFNAALDWVVNSYQNNPQQQLAWIVPGLHTVRDTIESKLLQQLDPSCFKILNPTPLAYYGLVETGLGLLKLSFSQSLELNQLISLLRSPYFGSMPEQEMHRAAFIHALRALQTQQFTWAVVIHTAEPWPELQRWLISAERSRLNKKQPLAKWVTQWRSVWQVLDFPHAARLNQQEQALYQCFEGLLAEFATLLPWQKPVSAAEAFQYVKQYAAKIFWQENENKSDAAIVISDVLDSLTLSIDQAWLMRATHNSIPFTLTINPLLDKKIQQHYALWACDRAEQDALSWQCYEQLRYGKQIFIISYAKENQGQIQMPAVFCATLEPTAYTIHPISIEPLQCPSPATHLTAWSKDSLPGGSVALKAQRLCPMQAFAKHRLNLTPLLTPVLGLTALERGIAVHRALQLVWQQLATQEHLLALAAEDLQKLLERIIPLALQIIPWSRRKLLPDAVLVLEQTYLTTVLTDWLAREASRPAFKIFSLEQETQIEFADKIWRLRIDRIDQLADGRLLLIDYKTGKTSLNSWQQEIFTEPQLPLYALTHTLNIDAIAFAELSRTKLKMIGLSEHTMDLGQFGVLAKTEQWSELTQQWYTQLMQLTADFVHSQAIVAPLEGDKTCQYCGLQSFCRIFETRAI